MANKRMEQAIQKAEQQRVSVEMVLFEFTLLTGRPATVSMPKDVSDLELLHMVGSVLGFGDQLRAQRATSRLILPRPQ